MIEQYGAGKKNEKHRHTPDMSKVKRYASQERHKQRQAEHRGKTVTLYKPEPATDSKTKKLQVYVEDPDTKKIKKVSFGHSQYEDYTRHGDTDRKDDYCARSKGLKGTNDVTSANYWSRKVLWNCP